VMAFADVLILIIWLKLILCNNFWNVCPFFDFADRGDWSTKLLYHLIRL